MQRKCRTDYTRRIWVHVRLLVFFHMRPKFFLSLRNLRNFQNFVQNIKNNQILVYLLGNIRVGTNLEQTLCEHSRCLIVFQFKEQIQRCSESQDFMDRLQIAMGKVRGKLFFISHKIYFQFDQFWNNLINFILHKFVSDPQSNLWVTLF